MSDAALRDELMAVHPYSTRLDRVAASGEPMIYDVDRHEPLRRIEWNPAHVELSIEKIVADAEETFSPDRYWPPHPKDSDGDSTEPLTPLYFGALGVIWALHHLRDAGATSVVRDYAPYLDALQTANRRWLGDDYEASKGAYLMGDTPSLMMAYTADPQTTQVRDQLDALIAGNIDHPSRELMWGAPGTMLAALFLYERTQDERWAHSFRLSASQLWSQLQWSDEHACHYWIQDLYGSQSTYLDAVHGFVATASPLIRGRALLTEAQWSEWQRCIVNTVSRTATWHEGQVNWRAMLRVPGGGKERFLMQFCHGAPGFITCLGDLPGDALDSVLAAAGETIWSAGPLAKGSNLCHGTGGNGFAFLKLYRRTGDRKWLDRARAFAMHGIAQTEADRRQYGRGRYSLWTGDVGFAIYLWQCLRETAAFPTLDVF
jgi:hypothetical protein